MLLTLTAANLVLLSAVALIEVATSLAGSMPTLPSIEYGALKSVQSGDRTASSFRSALSDDGLIIIEHVPLLAEARETALRSVQNCLRDTSSTADGLAYKDGIPYWSRTLADGTVRKTLAAQISHSTGGGRGEFTDSSYNEISATTSPNACVSIDSDIEALRNIVDRAAVAVGSAMDESFFPLHLQTRHGPPLFTTKATTGTVASVKKWNTFSDVINGGDQLEHFHSYAFANSNSINDENTKALHYHTDGGMFLVFVPAIYSATSSAGSAESEAEGSSGFWYQDRQGREHLLVVRDDTFTTELYDKEHKDSIVTVGADSLVLMMGQGAEEWINPVLKQQNLPLLRATPHALDFRNDMSDGPVNAIRTWYGRMFLPPAEAWFETQQRTFKELREDPHAGAAASQSKLPVGCGPMASLHDGSDTHRDLVDYSLAVEAMMNDENECTEGVSVYCWMTCMPLSDYDLNCSASDVICVNTEGEPVDPNIMDETNHLGCPNSNDDYETWTGDFCRGNGVNMYMSGFVSYWTGKYSTEGGNTTPQCLVLWFEEWKLDSVTKFAVACFGCVLLGILTESISVLRKAAKRATKNSPHYVQFIVLVSLYAGQLCLGYFDMLVAMTYQVELFVCIVAGLAIGHGIFHVHPAKPSPANKNKPIAPNQQVLLNHDNTGDVNENEGGDEENVDPCCAYLHVEEDKTTRF